MKKNIPRSKEEGLEYIPINDTYFSTCDLGCASALVSSGFNLASMQKLNKKKFQFTFLRQDEIDKAIDNYWLDKLEVKARSHFDNVKMLKNRIHSE